jgi:hypothetical protein
MKEQIRQIISRARDPLQAKNLTREYCQARMLQFLQEARIFRSWIFHGGTALRFLYGLPRYSEDLDFALENPGRAEEFPAVMERISKSFKTEAYFPEVGIKADRTVKSAFIRFPGLLFDLGISPHRTEALSIKIELDTNPPEGGSSETSLIRRHVLLNLRHYDRPSLFSGKLHAVLARSYPKGRDIYDLLWYLTAPEWPPPNIPFLNHALRQTHWDGPEITRADWTAVIAECIKDTDMKRAGEDVRPFIERSEEIDLMTKENLLKILASKTPAE